MNASERSQDRQVNQLSRTQIARATFQAAESMGISDRNHIERLTRQVIELLEEKRTTLTRGNMGPVRPLPGMEDLMPKSYQQQKHLTSESEILAMVKEFLDAEEPAQPQEVIPKMKIVREVCLGMGLQEILQFTLTSRETQETKMNMQAQEFVEIANPVTLSRSLFRKSWVS